MATKAVGEPPELPRGRSTKRLAELATVYQVPAPAAPVTVSPSRDSFQRLKSSMGETGGRGSLNLKRSSADKEKPADKAHTPAISSAAKDRDKEDSASVHSSTAAALPATRDRSSTVPNRGTKRASLPRGKTLYVEKQDKATSGGELPPAASEWLAEVEAMEARARARSIANLSSGAAWMAEIEAMEARAKAASEAERQQKVERMAALKVEKEKERESVKDKAERFGERSITPERVIPPMPQLASPPPAPHSTEKKRPLRLAPLSVPDAKRKEETKEPSAEQANGHLSPKGVARRSPGAGSLTAALKRAQDPAPGKPRVMAALPHSGFGRASRGLYDGGQALTASIKRKTSMPVTGPGSRPKTAAKTGAERTQQEPDVLVDLQKLLNTSPSTLLAAATDSVSVTADDTEHADTHANGSAEAHSDGKQEGGGLGFTISVTDTASASPAVPAIQITTPESQTQTPQRYVDADGTVRYGVTISHGAVAAAHPAPKASPRPQGSARARPQSVSTQLAVPGLGIKHVRRNSVNSVVNRLLEPSPRTPRSPRPPPSPPPQPSARSPNSGNTLQVSGVGMAQMRRGSVNSVVNRLVLGQTNPFAATA